ncbi:hypothetical protein [Longispora albida]|uniref:hypothetical protein n=1 Tax=Longispora albida TaxID=203523 RepID=UPI000477E7B5|nr:hypothetical protein [Longispora albida]
MTNTHASDDEETCVHDQQHTRLRATIRAQLAHAVATEALDIDVADEMLGHLDMAPLNRICTVRLDLPITMEISSTDAQEARHEALLAVGGALNDVEGLDVRWDRVGEGDATAGPVDTDNP